MARGSKRMGKSSIERDFSVFFHCFITSRSFSVLRLRKDF